MAGSVQTGMRLHQGQDFFTAGHVAEMAPPCDHTSFRVSMKLRLVGWLDQEGNVWMSDKDWMNAGGPHGSITPLLINPGCD